MSHRLQVLISPQLDARLQKTAQRNRISKGEWVRRALETSMKPRGKGETPDDPVARLGSLRAPAANINRMLVEIDAGRS
jgi:Ribbon-helix-helix protein, copG family.